MRYLGILLSPAVAVATVAASLPAQQPRGARGDGACEDRVISGVEIVREEPALIGRSAPRWSRPVLRTLLLHTLTKDVAIEPFLQFEPGTECSDFRLEETARVLRAQPYLAGATVTSVPDAGGGVRVRVETVDEIPLVIGGGIRDGRLSALTYGNANVRGTGTYAAAAWREGFSYRDGAVLRYRQYHAFGRPIQLGATLERAPLGRDISIDASRPFYTRFQHIGWHAGLRDASGYTGFQRPVGDRLSLEFARTRGDAGAVFRFGGQSALLFVGPFLTHQRFRPASDAVVIADTGIASDPDVVLDDRYESTSSTHVAGVLGARWLSHLEVVGFDALMGAQDIARGVQATFALGRSFGDLRGNVAAGHLFVGGGGATNFVGLSLLSEGQRRGSELANAVVSGRLAWYWKPSTKQTRIFGAEYSGAWRVDEPYQLALGDRQAGLRGYGDSRAVGARRAVLRAEQRWVLVGGSRWFALGAAGFGDLGKVWEGDAPFGVTTSTRASLGVSVLASIPRQSRRLLRVDFAVPLVHDPNAGRYEIRVSTSRSPREFWRDPSDIARLRAVLPPVGVFGWP